MAADCLWWQVTLNLGKGPSPGKLAQQEGHWLVQLVMLAIAYINTSCLQLHWVGVALGGPLPFLWVFCWLPLSSQEFNKGIVWSPSCWHVREGPRFTDITSCEYRLPDTNCLRHPFINLMSVYCTFLGQFPKPDPRNDRLRQDTGHTQDCQEEIWQVYKTRSVKQRNVHI